MEEKIDNHCPHWSKQIVNTLLLNENKQNKDHLTKIKLKLIVSFKFRKQIFPIIYIHEFSCHFVSW